MTTRQPMAFYHQDGFVASWNFATRYAGDAGHIATLPEIVEARLMGDTDGLAWTYFTTNSAEYYGIGADGREKLIVAHGVGPMSTLEGIKQAYSWEYKDTSQRKRGGRITAAEFLALEAGYYGDVSVIDFREYAKNRENWFYNWQTAVECYRDALLLARLGVKAIEYIGRHDAITRRWHSGRQPLLPTRHHPRIMRNAAAQNCLYTAFLEVGGRFDWSRSIPQPLENGYAICHLLHITELAQVTAGNWTSYTSDVGCQEWSNGFRFVGVPAGASWDSIANSPQPRDLLRRRWAQLMRPNTDEAYTPPRLFLVEQTDYGWFTHYPMSGQKTMDDYDPEFHVRSIEVIGDPRQFKVNELSVLRRHALPQIIALAPSGANAYEIAELSYPDGNNETTVTVRFYRADVDTSQRLPRAKEIKQNYDLLMKLG